MLHSLLLAKRFQEFSFEIGNQLGPVAQEIVRQWIQRPPWIREIGDIRIVTIQYRLPETCVFERGYSFTKDDVSQQLCDVQE